MKALVLGGTGFLSHRAAESLMSAGHDVVCAARGKTGTPPAQAQFLRWDRDDTPPPDLLRLDPDLVLDVSTNPHHVGEAVELFPGARWIYISTISVYSSMSEPGGTPENTPLHDPVVEPSDAMEDYGGNKVACERLVHALPNHMILRPGLIVGPGDPSDRFAYWPRRLAEASSDGLPFIAPSPSSDPVQWIDVRDLADWIAALAGADARGVCDAVGPSVERDGFLDEIASLFDPVPTPIWVSPDELESESIGFWHGDRAIPLWLPLPELRGMMARDESRAVELGLRTRPLADTSRDVLAQEGRARTGLTRTEEISALQRLGYLATA